jgi:hypothetical protein
MLLLGERVSAGALPLWLAMAALELVALAAAVVCCCVAAAAPPESMPKVPARPAWPWGSGVARGL